LLVLRGRLQDHPHSHDRARLSVLPGGRLSTAA
jgi:hypothetical protein